MDTLLVHANMVSVQVTRSSRRFRPLAKHARQQWMEGQVTEMAVVVEKGSLKPLYQFYKRARLAPKVAMPLFLPSRVVATTPQGVEFVWPHHIVKELDHRIRMVPFDSLARSLQEIQTRVQCCDNVVDTHETPALNSMQVENTVQQQEIVCDTVVPVNPCFLDWVNELSQVCQAPCVLARQLVWTLSRQKRADWRAKTTGASLRELRNKQSVAINFPNVWKCGIMCGVPKKARTPLDTRTVTRYPHLHFQQHYDWKGSQQTCLPLLLKRLQNRGRLAADQALVLSSCL